MSAISLSPPTRALSWSAPDGRRVAWSEWGPAEGRPVVFCTGAGMSGDLGFGAGFAEACRGALQAGFRQGAAGYARDTVLASRPGRGGWRRSRLPRCRREVVPGVGSAVLWTHAAQILAALIEDRDVG